MLCVWVHGCDPGRVSDGSRLALYQTLSIECPYLFLACALCYCSFLFVVFVLFFVLFLCSRWSFVDVPLIFSWPIDHVPDWQPRYIIGYGRGLIGQCEEHNKIVTEQYNRGLLPDIILLTQCYYHRGTRLNVMEMFCLCRLIAMIPPTKRFGFQAAIKKRLSEFELLKCCCRIF